jgi:acyl-CoA synthetase (NDP forming)
MTATSTDDLAGLFAPRGVAVVGASPHLSRAGGRVLRHLVDFGYSGGIYPVNPKYQAVCGKRCYPSVLEVPGPVDLVVICIPAPHVPGVLRDCGTRDVKAVVVHSDGFGGSWERGLGQQLRATWLESGLRVLGPNTNGLRVSTTGMFADASSGLGIAGFSPGPVAVITQSGGLGSYFGSTFLRQRGVGTKYLIDTGNEMDIDAADCLTYVAEDPEVLAVGLILESCRDGRRLAAATRRAVELGKQVIMVKLATSAASSAAAASHSGAIAGRFDVFRQVLTEAGAKVCPGTRQFADALAICGRGRVPAGPGIGIVTPSGGFGVLASDFGDRLGLTFPQPVSPPSEDLRKELPLASFANPFDLSTQHRNPATTLAHGIEYLASQPGIDSIVVWQPHALLNPDRRAGVISGLESAAQQFGIPFFLCGAAPQATRDELWASSRIISFESPDDLLTALGLLVGSDSRPAATPSAAETSAATVGDQATAALSTAKEIEFVRRATPGSAAAAVQFATELGRPVILKLQAAHHAHKTELGLVVGPVKGNAITSAYAELDNKREFLGEGEITVEAFEEGVEIALGALTDPSFGRIVMVGAGGRLVELLGDVSFAPAPVTPERARQMIERLTVYHLLSGYRGSPPADIDALVRALVSLSRLVSDPRFDYTQVDLNPIIVRPTGEGAVAVDCLLTR